MPDVPIRQGLRARRVRVPSPHGGAGQAAGSAQPIGRSGLVLPRLAQVQAIRRDEENFRIHRWYLKILVSF